MSEETRYNAEYQAVMDEIMNMLPGVKISKAFGYPAYKINGKVFAFVGGATVALKLPQARVQELITRGAVFAPFEVAEGIIWRNWVSISHENPAHYHQDEPLFIESLQYVVENS